MSRLAFFSAQAGLVKLEPASFQQRCVDIQSAVVAGIEVPHEVNAAPQRAAAHVAELVRGQEAAA